MATRRIRDYLTGSGVWYSLTSHPTAYTAQEVAQATHLPGRCMAKNVIVTIDGELAMAVVPATREVNLKGLRDQVGAKEVRLADEACFAEAFSECQVGSVPPFGVLFGVRIFIDISLALQEQIAFNAGTHTDVVRMWYTDYARMAKPLVMQISMPEPVSKVKSRLNTARRDTHHGLTAHAPQVHCGLAQHLGCD